MNINITGLTNSDHFDMLQKFLSDSGQIHNLSEDDAYKFFSGESSYCTTRKVWGATYTTEISYNVRTDTFNVKCS